MVGSVVHRLRLCRSSAASPAAGQRRQSPSIRVGIQAWLCGLAVPADMWSYRPIAAAPRVKAAVGPGGASTVAARHGEPVGGEPRQGALSFFWKSSSLLVESPINNDNL